MRGLLFITHATERYGYLDSVRIALEGGCRRVQLRMKGAPDDEAMRVGAAAKELCDRHGAHLYIDDRPGICLALGAAGVHLGKSDMPPAEARRMLGPGFAIGGTANTFDDIERLTAQGVDYIGLGPFRFTETKKNLSPVLGLDGCGGILRRCREVGITLPVVAIGGIAADDIPAIVETGVSGIALSSAILAAPDPVSETRRIIRTINDCQI
jgi:thiamine-phosphate pyrophosphorylase